MIVISSDSDPETPACAAAAAAAAAVLDTICAIASTSGSTCEATALNAGGAV